MVLGYWAPILNPSYKDPLCLLDLSSVDLQRDVSPIPYIDVDAATGMSGSISRLSVVLVSRASACLAMREVATDGGNTE